MERTLEEGSHGIWKGCRALSELLWLPADLGNRAPLKFLETREDRRLGGMVAVAKCSRKMESQNLAPPEDLILTTVT